MFSQRNNPYCELLSDYAMNIDKNFFLVKRFVEKNLFISNNEKK